MPPKAKILTKGKSSKRSCKIKQVGGDIKQELKDMAIKILTTLKKADRELLNSSGSFIGSESAITFIIKCYADVCSNAEMSEDARTRIFEELIENIRGNMNFRSDLSNVSGIVSMLFPKGDQPNGKEQRANVCNYLFNVLIGAVLCGWVSIIGEEKYEFIRQNNFREAVYIAVPDN